MTLANAAVNVEAVEAGRTIQLSRWLLGTFGIAVTISILGFLFALIGGAFVLFKLAVTGLVTMVLGLVVTSACINIARQMRQSY